MHGEYKYFRNSFVWIEHSRLGYWNFGGMVELREAMPLKARFLGQVLCGLSSQRWTLTVYILNACSGLDARSAPILRQFWSLLLLLAIVEKEIRDCSSWNSFKWWKNRGLVWLWWVQSHQVWSYEGPATLLPRHLCFPKLVIVNVCIFGMSFRCLFRENCCFD